MQLFLEIPYFVGNPVSLSNLDSYILDIVFKSEIQAIAYIFQKYRLLRTFFRNTGYCVHFQKNPYIRGFKKGLS